MVDFKSRIMKRIIIYPNPEGQVHSNEIGKLLVLIVTHVPPFWHWQLFKVPLHNKPPFKLELQLHINCPLLLFDRIHVELL